MKPYGWNDVLSVVATFATAGLLSGIVGGMVFINLGARLGWTRLVASANELPEGLRVGFLPDEEQTSLGRETVSPLASIRWPGTSRSCWRR